MSWTYLKGLLGEWECAKLGDCSHLSPATPTTWSEFGGTAFNTFMWLPIVPGTTEWKVEAKVLEICAADGTRITGFTGHGIERAIGDGAERAGTTPGAILDALKNPESITGGVDQMGRPFKIFRGKDARVVANPNTGRIVSTNPLSRGGAQ